MQIPQLGALHVVIVFIGPNWQVSVEVGHNWHCISLAQQNTSHFGGILLLLVLGL